MIPVLAALAARSAVSVLHGADTSYRGDEVLDAVHQTAAELQAAGIQRLALAADNGPGWLIVDLAARLAGITLVPVPDFFTAGQREHVFETAGIQGIASEGVEVAGFSPAGRVPCGLRLHVRERAPTSLPDGTSKITFTSGTTGRPKGVCLSDAAQDRVARALARATAHLPLTRHLATLPLSLLLENVAGAYIALLRGCEVVLPPLHRLGWNGSSSLDIASLTRAIDSAGADSLILLPQMLKDLVHRWRPPAANFGVWHLSRSAAPARRRRCSNVRGDGECRYSRVTGSANALPWCA
jgi:acyl-CoA synthetase (AMP-forming)/AMP-acid ligase II